MALLRLETCLNIDKFHSRYHNASVDPTRASSANQSEDEDSKRSQSGKGTRKSGQSERGKVASSSFWDEKNKRELTEMRKMKEKRKKMAGKAMLGGSLENFAYDEWGGEGGEEGEGGEGLEWVAMKERSEGRRERSREMPDSVTRKSFKERNQDDEERNQDDVSRRRFEDFKARKRSKNRLNRKLKMSEMNKDSSLKYGEQSYF